MNNWEDIRRIRLFFFIVFTNFVEFVYGLRLNQHLSIDAIVANTHTNIIRKNSSIIII